MFDWLGDIFNSDTFDTLKGGFGDLAQGVRNVSPYVQGGLSLINGIDSMNRSRNFAAQQGATADQLAQLFSPNSPYAQTLRQQLERRDAAAGRRSQYGPREVELAAALAKNQAGVLGSPQYQQLLAGRNRSPYGGLMGSLGDLFSFRDKQGNFKTPPGTSKALSYLSDTLFPVTPDVSIAGLGGANSALATGAEATPDALGALAGGTGQLPTYGEAGGPQATGIFNSSNPLTGDLGISQGLGTAGTGAGLGGSMAAGELGSTVGGLDTAGSLFGGTGFLPSYGAAAEGAGMGAGGTAGLEGLFAGGAGGSAGAEGAGLLGAGASSLVALPFALAIGGMLNGIFGPEDGPGYSNRDNANTAIGNYFGAQTTAEGAERAGYDVSKLTPDAYGGSGGGVPLYDLWKVTNAIPWLNEGNNQEFYQNALKNYGVGNQNGLDMNHIYYTQDNPLLATYMNYKYGAPNQQQMRQGLGGYSEDQYGEAWNGLIGSGGLNWMQPFSSPDQG